MAILGVTVHRMHDRRHRFQRGAPPGGLATNQQGFDGGDRIAGTDAFVITVGGVGRAEFARQLGSFGSKIDQRERAMPIVARTGQQHHGDGDGH